MKLYEYTKFIIHYNKYTLVFIISKDIMAK